MRRFRWLLLAGPIAVLPLFALPFVAVAEVPASVDHYVASAKAGAVHVFAYDNTEQFATVDSSFPLAFSTQAGQSGLGYSDATSSYYDYGPAGVTLLGVPDGQGVNSGLGPGTLPPAHASYPGRGQSTLYPTQPSFGAPGPPPGSGAYATAQADELSSKAFATYVGPTGIGLSGLTSQTSSVLGSDGSVLTTAQAFVGQAIIGPFTFDKIDVIAGVASAGGTGRVAQSSATVGAVLVNGQAVTLTDQGLTVGPETVPLASSGTQSAGTITYTAQLVAPQQTLNGPEATLNVTGVKVTAVEALPTGDILTEEYELGNAAVDGSLTPAEASSGTGLSLSGGGLGSLPGGASLSAGGFPSTLQAPAQPATKSAPAPRLVLVAASRKPLAVAFLGWEALVMCGVAAWVWARKTVTL